RLKKGDYVVLTLHPDPKLPARDYGYVESINWEENKAEIKVAEEFVAVLDDEQEVETGMIKRDLDTIDKPLEIFYEQIAARNAKGLSLVETSDEKRQASYEMFKEQRSEERRVGKE